MREMTKMDEAKMVNTINAVMNKVHGGADPTETIIIVANDQNMAPGKRRPVFVKHATKSCPSTACLLPTRVSVQDSIPWQMPGWLLNGLPPAKMRRTTIW